MMFLRMPPAELMQDLPEGVTVESALKTWHAGFALGYQGGAYHDMQRLELQHILADGYHRGQAERAVEDEIDRALGAGETGKSPGLREKARAYCSNTGLAIGNLARGAGLGFGAVALLNFVLGRGGDALLDGTIACACFLVAIAYGLKD